VVSKVSQVHKEKNRCIPHSLLEEPSTPAVKVVSRKRSAPSPPSPENDAVLETLSRLEEQQADQRRLIEQLLQQPSPPPTTVEQQAIFETAFMNFINAYRSLPCEERQNKVRKVINSSNVSDLSEFILLCAGPDENSIHKVPVNISALDDCYTSLTDGVSRNELDALMKYTRK